MKGEQILDLESQRILLSAMNSRLKQQNQICQIENQTLKKLESQKRHRIHFQIGMMVTMIVVVSVTYFVGASSDASYVDSEYKTRYSIENLRGDTIDTAQHWNLIQGKQITVNIVNSDTISKEVLSAITDAILSEEVIQVEDSLLHKGPIGTTSTYYKGWYGALKEASKSSTEFYIPTEFVILKSSKGEGEITVRLLTEKDTDGYSGYTKSITENDQILKSTITIYDVDSLSAEQAGTIMRHEFGHAMGLAHSSDPEDLMAPQIATQYPYISECAVDAISALYDDMSTSRVVCQK